MKLSRCRLLSLTLGAVLALSPSFANAGSFTGTGGMQFARRRHTATRLSTGKVLVAGGANSTGTLGTAEVFNPATGSFARTGNMQTARVGHTATLLASGKVLIVGGTGAAGTPLASSELFNPATGIFTHTGNMRTARVGHTATLLGNGKVLVAGGGTASAELFDPNTGVFTATNNMIATRMGHTAMLLKNGKVLLAGGTEVTAVGDLFDPATSTFSATANGGIEGFWLSATLLQDGRVFLTGGEVTKLVSGRGFLFGPFSSALGILFTTSNESFLSLVHMLSSRAFHSATGLGNGQVLIAGGANVTSYAQLSTVITRVTPLASAELFNPTTLSFTNTGNMTIARSWHTATILGNGNVLVVGGVDASGNVLSSAEQYH